MLLFEIKIILINQILKFLDLFNLDSWWSNIVLISKRFIFTFVSGDLLIFVVPIQKEFDLKLQYYLFWWKSAYSWYFEGYMVKNFQYLLI